MNEPLLLSILIPAYRYPEGVQRILRQFGVGRLPSFAYEILVSDDSPDTDLEKPLRQLAAQLCLPLDYVHNVSALGAPANWNNLLAKARGRYVWLLHHDEFPMDEDFLIRLGEQLKPFNGSADPEILLLDCVLVDPVSGRSRRHLPPWLRRAVTARAPSYLWRRNVIGPASCLVVRRGLFPRFNTGLRWLVDVDAYTRMLRQQPRQQWAFDLAVGSVLHRDDSITASLHSELARVRQQECCELLRAQDTASPRWLSYLSSCSLGRLICGVEMVAWAGLRAVTWGVGHLSIGSRSRANILQALHGSTVTTEP